MLLFRTPTCLSFKCLLPHKGNGQPTIRNATHILTCGKGEPHSTAKISEKLAFCPKYPVLSNKSLLGFVLYCSFTVLFSLWVLGSSHLQCHIPQKHIHHPDFSETFLQSSKTLKTLPVLSFYLKPRHLSILLEECSIKPWKMHLLLLRGLFVDRTAGGSWVIQHHCHHCCCCWVIALDWECGRALLEQAIFLHCFLRQSTF